MAAEVPQRVELGLAACGGAIASVKVIAVPDYVEEHVAQHLVPHSNGGPKLILLLPPGYHDIYLRSARCHTEVRLAVISGFDRHVAVPPGGPVLWDSTNAVAGRLPAGISKATLYSLDKEGSAVDATIDQGAYYADQDALRGLYILVLESKRSPKKAQLAVDLSKIWKPPLKALERRDISDDEYRAALGQGASPFSHPTKIIQGPGDAMWFLNPTGNSVGRVGASGGIEIYQLPTFDGGPADIAATDTAIWVTEFKGDRIARVTPDGRVAEFAFPASLALQPGDGRGYRGPEYMAVGSDGRIWFSERFNPAIGAIDQDGSITEYPITGDFVFSCCLVRGVDGRVWLLADVPYTGPSALFAVSKDGSVQRFPLDGAFSTIAPAKNGVWIGGSAGQARATQVMHVDNTGTTKAFETPLQLAEPRHLVESSTGSLWFTDPDGNTIGNVSSDGAVRQVYRPLGIADLLVGVDGNLLYTLPALGEIVRRLSDTGGQIYVVRGHSADPTQLALGRVGDVWFTEFDGNAVGVIHPSGKVDRYPLPVAK